MYEYNCCDTGESGTQRTLFRRRGHPSNRPLIRYPARVERGQSVEIRTEFSLDELTNVVEEVDSDAEDTFGGLYPNME